MAIRRFNGGIIGSRNLANPTSTVGVWTPGEIQLARLSNLWPVELTPFVGVQIFNESTSWVPPTSVTSVEYFIVAGGGGGGGGQ
jgi:hypothetical protein